MFSLNQVIKGNPQQEENNETKFFCKICKALFQQESQFQNHNCSSLYKEVEALKNNQEEQTEIVDYQTETEVFQCNSCDKQFRRKKSLLNHDLSVHKNTKQFHCTICNKQFTDKNYLSTHIEIVHFNIRHFQCEHVKRNLEENLTLKVMFDLNTKISKTYAPFVPRGLQQFTN